MINGKVDLILFPSSYYSLDRPDEDLRVEYDAAYATGLFDIALFGYDKWFQEGKLILKNAPETKRLAVHRGWMMRPDQYEAFYERLLENNIELITTPREYALMHVFPNIFQKFGNDTARMLTFPLHERIDVELMKRNFDRFLVKDYVKSVKGTEFPACFDASITQEEFDRWMEVFYKYRGSLLTGGICVKEWLPLKRYGNRTNEWRVFYVNHQPLTISRNSAQGSYAPEVPRDLIMKYANLDSIYYTVDYAELEDGSFKVIEAGDGSVSGLSEFQDAEQYYRALYHCLN